MIRCVQCNAEFPDDVEGACCPQCGTEALPCRVAQDVTVRINWHELRILTIWASNYAASLEPESRKTLSCIIRRLEEQRPDSTFAALTLAGEVRDFQQSGEPGAETVELRSAEGEVLVPKLVKN